MIFSQIKTYLFAFVAGAAAIGLGILGFMLHSARDKADKLQRKVQSKQAAIEIYRVNNRHERKVRHARKTTRQEIDQMEDVGRQRVGDAKPGTAAGWLRRHANRDDSQAGD